MCIIDHVLSNDNLPARSRVTTADMESAGGSGTARSSAAPTTPSNPRHGSRRSGTADSPGSEDNQIAVTLPHSHLYAR